MGSALLADRVVKRAPVSLARAIGGATPSYDPATDTWTTGAGGSVLSATSTARALQPSPADAVRYEANGWRITDIVVLEIDAWLLRPFLPAIGDGVTWAGSAWTIQEFQTIAPAGTTKSYIVVATQ